VGSFRRADPVLGGQSMMQFIWGVLLGFSLGYPFGLWAVGYKPKDKNND
jgi:hypothetical protein